MTPRERTLAIIVGALVLVLVLAVGSYSILGSYRTQKNLVTALESSIGDVESNRRRARMASNRHLEYKELSLEADASVARTQYNDWLLKTTREHGLKNVSINKQGPFDKKFAQTVVARELRFIVKAEADLKQLTEFLFHFHSADVLHRIADLNLQPETKGGRDDEKNNNIIATLTIEALALPEGPEERKIKSDYTKRLLDDELEQYTSTILPRNLFGLPNNPPRWLTKSRQEEYAGDRISISLRASDPDEDDVDLELIESEVEGVKLSGSRLSIPSLDVGEYKFKLRALDDHPDQKSTDLEIMLAVVERPKPKPKEVEPPKPAFDPSVRTEISSIVRDRTGVRQVWINIKPTGERLRLTVDEEFEVGPHKGKVVAINSKYAILEVDGEQGMFKPGDNFTEPRPVEDFRP